MPGGRPATRSTVSYATCSTCARCRARSPLTDGARPAQDSQPSRARYAPTSDEPCTMSHSIHGMRRKSLALQPPGGLYVPMITLPEEPHLVRPTTAVRISYLTGEQADCLMRGIDTKWLGRACDDFDAFVAARREVHTEWDVPTTIFWY